MLTDNRFIQGLDAFINDETVDEDARDVAIEMRRMALEMATARLTVAQEKAEDSAREASRPFLMVAISAVAVLAFAIKFLGA